MAQATIEAVRSLRADVQFAFTFFSPSAERVAQSVGADVATYLPWDTTLEMKRVLEAMRPAVIAFVRTEVWPVLTRRAAQQRVSLALVNAVLAEGSSRLGLLPRVLLRPAYARLSSVGAVTKDDAQRLAELGVAPERVRVTGDARFDQVWRRIRNQDREAPLLNAFEGDVPLMVAGSTWPSDEERLVEALARAKARSPLRSAIAPHEPTRQHIQRLEALLGAAGLSHERVAAVEWRRTTAMDVTIVDRVGVLADLYGVAAFAYVGGGFGRAGLHSVVEPAALGIPVLFGPTHGNAREAGELRNAGGGFMVSNASDLAAAIVRFVENPEARKTAGEAALAYVRSRLGGADRNAALVVELIR